MDAPTETTPQSSDASQMLVVSITTNLDAMERASLRAVLLAVVALWFGLGDGRAASLRVFDVNVPVERSAWVLAVVVAAASLECAFRMLRVSAMLESLDETNVTRGLFALWSHPWLFNPLSWSGSSPAARRAGLIGTGLSLGLLAASMAAVFSLGLMADRVAAAAAACMTAASGLAFARAADHAARAAERVAKGVGEDGTEVDATLLVASAEVARRARVFFGAVVAGVAATMSLSLWWVLDGR